MIEVRTAYRVKMPDAEGPVEELAQQCREQVWPILGWQGRFQQMLQGSSQQSIFVWSFQWPGLTEWLRAMADAEACDEYRTWRDEIAPRLLYGAGQEIFTVIDPAHGRAAPLDNTPRRIEVRSSYIARIDRLAAARELMVRTQDIAGWSGQNQELLCGSAAPGMFVWSSTWDNMTQWEAAMGADDDDLEAWFGDWVATVDFGGTREVFRNL
jgi:hypothetical protein